MAFTGCDGRCEPSVATDPEGRVFVTTYGGSMVAVSDDGGQKFEAFSGPPLPAHAPEGARHNDALVQVGPGGQLYFSSFVPGNRDLGSVLVARSEDGARSWASVVLLAVDPASPSASVTAVPDRQWLGFGADGAVYASYTLVPGGSFVARSDDAGQTFGPFLPASTAVDRATFGQASPVVALPSGRILMAALARASPTSPSADGLAGVHVSLSDDRGVTWRGVNAHSVAPPASAGFQFPMVSVTEAGAVHVAWVDEAGTLHLITSTDGGDSWSAPVAWSLPDESVPTAAWPESGGNTTRVVYYAVKEELSIIVASGSAPDPANRVVVASGIEPGSGALAGGLGEDPRLAARTDFASAAAMPDGSLATTWTNAEGEVLVKIVEG